MNNKTCWNIFQFENYRINGNSILWALGVVATVLCKSVKNNLQEIISIAHNTFMDLNQSFWGGPNFWLCTWFGITCNKLNNDFPFNALPSPTPTSNEKELEKCGFCYKATSCLSCDNRNPTGFTTAELLKYWSGHDRGEKGPCGLTRMGTHKFCTRNSAAWWATRSQIACPEIWSKNAKVTYSFYFPIHV